MPVSVRQSCAFVRKLLTTPNLIKRGRPNPPFEWNIKIGGFHNLKNKIGEQPYASFLGQMFECDFADMCAKNSSTVDGGPSGWSKDPHWNKRKFPFF